MSMQAGISAMNLFSYLCKKKRMKHIIHSETKTLIHNNS